MLNGYEELESGPMRKACRLGQVWLIEPAGLDDLFRAEGKWQDAARELHEARERLRAAGLG